MYGDEIVGVDLPAAVELTVTETEPGIQGDRVSGARKPATLETGLVVQVPLFVNIGDKLKVDTRSGEYITRGLTAWSWRAGARRAGPRAGPGASCTRPRPRASPWPTSIAELPVEPEAVRRRPRRRRRRPPATRSTTC